MCFARTDCSQKTRYGLLGAQAFPLWGKVDGPLAGQTDEGVVSSIELLSFNVRIVLLIQTGQGVVQVAEYRFVIVHAIFQYRIGQARAENVGILFHGPDLGVQIGERDIL